MIAQVLQLTSCCHSYPGCVQSKAGWCLCPCNPGEESSGKATATVLRESFNKNVSDAACKFFLSHLASAETAARAWLSRQAAALDLPRQANAALLGKLQKHLPEQIRTELSMKQEATDLVVGVITHVADRLRSEASPDDVVLVDALTGKGDQVFTALDEKTLDALEPLATAPPDWLRTLPSLVDDFLSPLAVWLQRREKAALQDLGKFVTRLLQAQDPSSVLKDAKDVKSVIAGKAKEIQTPLLAILGAVEEVHCMQGPDNPFSRCSKRHTGGRLQEQLQVLDQELLSWAFDPEHSATPAPVLQQAGVCKDLAQSFLVKAREAQRTAGSAQIRRRLAELKTRKTELAKLFDGVAEPPNNEAKFLTYMQKHGGRLSTLLKEIQKEVTSTESLAKSLGLSRPEIDTEGLVGQAKALAEHTTSLISIFTLASLLRYPMIHSPQEQEMRKALAEVSSQLEQDNVGCPAVYLAEAKELLQNPIATCVADSPAGDVAMASGVAATSAVGGAAPRALSTKPKAAKATAAPTARAPKRTKVTG